MRGELWATHLVIGLVVVAAGVGWTWHVGEQRRLEQQPTRSTTVREALGPAGTRDELVRLTDLVVDCERMRSVDGHVYAPGFDGRGFDFAVVEVEPGQSCSTLAERTHRIDPAPADAVSEVFDYRRPPRPDQVIRASRGSRGVGYLVTTAVVALGLGWVLFAWRRRREYRQALAEALARAAAPRVSTPVEAEERGGPYRASAEATRWLPRPLRLRPRARAEQRRKGVAAMLAGVALLATTVGWAGGEASELRAEQARWNRGRSTHQISASGDLRSRALGLLESATFRYVYYDDRGRPHVGERSFSSAFGGVQGRDLTVRYDPADPEHHAISWLGEDNGPVWASLGLLALLGLALATGAFLVARRALATSRLWTRILEEPQEIELVLQSRVEIVHRGVSTGAVEYRFAVPGSDEPLVYVAPDPSLSPFYLDLRGTRALGLRNPKHPGAVMVLLADLAPLEVELGVDAGIRQRYRQSKGSASSSPNP